MYWQKLEGRHIEGGINWVWYHTDTLEDAEKWYFELTGQKVPDYVIIHCTQEVHIPAKISNFESRLKHSIFTEKKIWKGYAFRIHR